MATDAPSTPSPTTATVAPTAAQDLDACRALAMELAQLGMARLRALHAEAAEATPEPPALAHAIERAERGVRQSILLVQRLAEREGEAAADGRAGARRRVIRAVEDRIAVHARLHGDGADPVRLRAEFLQRLDSPELEDDLLTRPEAEVVAEICRDLGVDAPDKIFLFKRRTPEDLAVLHALAARPPGAPPHLVTRYPPPDPAPPPPTLPEDDAAAVATLLAIRR